MGERSQKFEAGRVIGATCRTGQKITTQSPGTPEAQGGEGHQLWVCSRWESASKKKAVGGACSSESGWFFLPLPAFSPPPQSFFPNGFSFAHFYSVL